MAGRGGERLLSAFRAANCPGVAAWTGSDLDWVYEIPGAEEFLDKLASSINAEAGDGFLSLIICHILSKVLLLHLLSYE